MGSLVDLNMLSIIIEELNTEIHYKISETHDAPIEDFLSLLSTGDEHGIMFLGQIIWSSELEKQNEDIPIRIEIDLNERSKFESHLRLLVNDKLNILKSLEL